MVMLGYCLTVFAANNFIPRIASSGFHPVTLTFSTAVRYLGKRSDSIPHVSSRCLCGSLRLSFFWKGDGT